MIGREVRLISLPMKAALEAGHDSGLSDHRELVIVHLIDDDSGAEGWGECAALNHAGYTHEFARGAYEALASGSPFAREAAPMAAAAIEMAELDLKLRASGISLAKHLGTAANTVAAGATIGLGSTSEVIARAQSLVDAGYTRIKIKITPDTPVAHLEALSDRFPNLELQADANGTFTAAQIGQLLEFAPLAISVLEQPFAPDDIEALIALRGQMGAWVLVDEGARPAERIEALVAADAIDGVVVKPSIVGISGAVEVIERVASGGLAVSIGGMVESALGRHMLAAFAARLDVSVVGDTSPSGLWLDDDPWPDLPMLNGEIGVSKVAGVGPLPDLDRLERCTVECARRDHTDRNLLTTD